MAGKWYVCSAQEGEGVVTRWLAATNAQAVVVREGNPWRLRALVREETGRPPSVVVGAWRGGLDPVNVAAALVQDACAGQVVLACRRASGSLRSRAARAGITRVLTLQEMAAEANEKASKASKAATTRRSPTRAQRPQKGSLDDLDEPEGIAVAAASASGSAGSGGASGPGDTAGLDAVPGTGAPLLCVASGRGGVGKTALAATMACAAASWGMRVALVDLDLGSGNLASCLGLKAGADLAALSGLDELSEQDVLQLGVSVGERLTLWGPCERPEMAETLSWRVARLLTVLRETHDLVIVDTSTTFTDAVAQAIQACDRLLLVADDRTRAVASLSRAAALAVRLGVARTRIVRVMNHCLPRSRDDAGLYRAAVGLETARTCRIAEGEEEVAELLELGRARELSQQGGGFATTAASCIASVLSELGSLPESPAAAKALRRTSRPRHGLFGRMREAS